MVSQSGGPWASLLGVMGNGGRGGFDEGHV